MALINKIRERSGLAIGIIAISLGAFVLLGDFLNSNSSLMGNSQIVGEIAGEEIDYNEFQEEMMRVEQNFVAQNGQGPTEADMPGLREQAWNQLIFKIAFQKEFDRLGITVTDEEMVDMVQGNNVHPAIRQAFVDPQTQQFDRSQVVNYLKNFDQLQPEQRAMWTNFEASLGPDRLRTKFTNLMKNSEYVTTAEAKQHHAAQNAKASVKFMYIPFFTINDTTIKVTDDELEAYLSKNRERYNPEEGRSLQYVAISVNPSGADSANIRNEVAELAKQFRNAENDSMFVRANSDADFNAAYIGMSDLPQALRDQMPLQTGTVYGPVLENNSYQLYKVINTKEDSVSAIRASHILFKANGETDEAKAEAQKKASEVLAQIKGGASFEEMARQHGTDGTAAVGGDLGWFTQGRMVKEFEDAVFNFNSTGLLPQPVKTQFGYHIIKVTEPETSRKYQLATVTRNIESSDDTKDEAFRKADELAGTSTDLASFNANIAKDQTLVRTEAVNIGPNDRNINNVTNAREVIRWAYSDVATVGAVSPVFETDDKFVVAVLTGKRQKGQPKVEDLREELTAAVRTEKKAEMILNKLKGVNGTLDEMAAKYGADATVKTADNVTFGANTIQGLGTEPVAVGKTFSLKPGAHTAPFKGETGVIAIELVSLTPAGEPGDLTAIKKQLASTRSMRAEGNIYEVVKEKADIKDNRAKYF